MTTGDVPRGTCGFVNGCLVNSDNIINPTTYFTKENPWYIINNVCFPYKTRHLLSMRVDTERFGKLC